LEPNTPIFKYAKIEPSFAHIVKFVLGTTYTMAFGAAFFSATIVKITIGDPYKNKNNSGDALI
jgi:hypothetical protein